MKELMFGAVALLAKTVLEPTLCRIKGHKKPLNRIDLNGQPHAVCGACGDWWPLSNIG